MVWTYRERKTRMAFSDSEDSTEDDLDGDYKDAEDAAKVEEAEYEENEFEVREEAPLRITRKPADPNA